MKNNLLNGIEVLVLKDIEDSIICCFNKNTVINITEKDFLKKIKNPNNMNIDEVLKLVNDITKESNTNFTKNQLIELYNFKLKNYSIKNILFIRTISSDDIMEIVDKYEFEELKNIFNFFKEN